MTLLSYLGGGLWIIPLLTFTGSVIFGIVCYKSSHSGSVNGPDATKNKLNVGYLVFSVALLVATVVIVVLMRADK